MPKAKLSGNEPAAFADHTIEIEMRQWEVTFGIKYLFGEPPVALK